MSLFLKLITHRFVGYEYLDIIRRQSETKKDFCFGIKRMSAALSHFYAQFAPSLFHNKCFARYFSKTSETKNKDPPVASSRRRVP